MKSLLLAYDYPPMGGGIARALGEIARPSVLGPEAVSTGGVAGAELTDRRSEVPILRAPVPVERLRSLPGLLRWCRSAGRIAQATSPEFIWAGNLKPAGYVARWLASRRRLPYGIIVYGLDLIRVTEQARRSRRKRLIARTILGGASSIVAISGWTAERYRELAGTLGLPAVDRVLRVVPLGTDPMRFAPAGPAAALGPGRWLLTVARLMPHKGIDTALAALTRVAARHPEVRYAIAGEGPDRGRLERLVHQLGQTDRVRFLGRVEDPDLPGLYRAAALYVGLSREAEGEVEGFGLSLVEAQASGIPVLAGRSGGAADALGDGTTGWLVDPTDVGLVADRLDQLLGDGARLREAGAAGRALVERHLNWARVGRDLRAVMEGVRRNRG